MRHFITLIVVLFVTTTCFASDYASERITNKAEIARFQDILYEYGFDVGAPDGVIGPKTEAAIRTLERKLKLEPTGLLTPTIFSYVINRGYPQGWFGAVSISSDFTSIGGAYRYLTRKAADEAAIAQCRLRAGPQATCHTKSGYVGGNTDASKWVTILNCQRSKRNQVFLQTDSTAAHVFKAGLARAVSQGYQPTDCKPLVAIAADGSHEQQQKAAAHEGE